MKTYKMTPPKKAKTSYEISMGGRRSKFRLKKGSKGYLRRLNRSRARIKKSDKPGAQEARSDWLAGQRGTKREALKLLAMYLAPN